MLCSLFQLRILSRQSKLFLTVSKNFSLEKESKRKVFEQVQGNDKLMQAYPSFILFKLLSPRNKKDNQYQNDQQNDWQDKEAKNNRSC